VLPYAKSAQQVGHLEKIIGGVCAIRSILSVVHRRPFNVSSSRGYRLKCLCRILQQGPVADCISWFTNCGESKDFEDHYFASFLFEISLHHFITRGSLIVTQVECQQKK
jgi:hypothetical protein